MDTIDVQIRLLESVIAAQEALRPSLGNSATDLAIAVLRSQVQALRQEQATARADLAPSAAVDESMSRLQSYLPLELAEKMREGGRVPGDRRLVTVLLADLSGYVALSERMDPEDVAELSNELLKELAECVYQYEGYVATFAGDSITAVFGAPVAHEDDPERALRAALAMRERAEAISRRWQERVGKPLQLHVGINTGTVVAGDVGHDLRLQYTVIGDTINIAARLESIAQAGQILVSSETYESTRAAFTFTPVGQLRIDGREGLVVAFELERAKLYPDKSLGLTGLGTAFVGREQEMASLRAVATDLAAGFGQLVEIVGEAGLGKSRLTIEWRRELGEAVRWLVGRSFAYLAALPFGPFLNILREVAEITDDDSELVARERLHATVGRLFPEDPEAHALLASIMAMHLDPAESAILDRLAPEAVRRRLFALAEDLFQRLAVERPTVLVIEDVHWADATSMELLHRLLPLTDRVPLAIVAVRRPDAASPTGTLLPVSESEQPDRYTRIVLSPLTETASAEMIEQLLLSATLPARVRAMILSKAEGNPFFLEEVIRALIDRGALVQSPGDAGWSATPLIDTVTAPDTLQGLLMSRLDRLPSETKWVIQQAAVIGRIFLYRVLSYVAHDPPSLAADLGQLERLDLVRERARDPEIEFIFKHALTQDVAYQSLLAPRRREVHRRVGAAYEALFADRLDEFNGVLAEHFRLGEVWDKAADYYDKVADAASRQFATAEAWAHYRRSLEALAHLSDTVENRRRRIDTSVALSGESLYVDAQKSLALLGEVEPIARALGGADNAPAADRLRFARVQHERGRARIEAHQLAEAISDFQEVLAIGEGLGDEDLLALPSFTIGQVLQLQGHFDQAEPLFVQALAPLERAGKWKEWIDATGYLGTAQAASGRYREGLASAERALQRALELDYLPGIVVGHIYVGCAYCLGGDFPAMADACQRSLRVAEDSENQILTYIAAIYHVWAESLQGRLDLARESMKKADAIAIPVIGDQRAAIWALFALQTSELAKAAASAQEAVAICQQTQGIYAEGLAQRTWGQALAGLGSEHWSEAQKKFAISARLFEEGGCRVEYARTQLIWGEACLERDDPAARDHVAQAVAALETTDLADELARARALLETL